jgi:CRP/FNR family transcriptional regulator
MSITVGLPEISRVTGIPLRGDDPQRGWTFPLRHLPRAAMLVHQGDRLRSIYVVFAGFLRSRQLVGGMEHIVGFPMKGDVIGLDSVGSGTHQAGAVALTDAEVAIVPYSMLECAGTPEGFSQHLLLELMARESARVATHIGVLACPTAAARVAGFLLALSDAFGRRGYSRSAFMRPMRNSDVANHLGLRAETVSRTIAALRSQGLIDVRLRMMVILDEAGLRAIAESDRSRLQPARARSAEPVRAAYPSRLAA